MIFSEAFIVFIQINVNLAIFFLFFVLCEGFPFASGKLAALEFQIPQMEVFKSVTTCITRKKDCRIVLFSFSFQFGCWMHKMVNIFSYLVMNHTSKDLSSLRVQRLSALAMLTFVSALRPFYTTTDNLSQYRLGEDKIF